MQISEDHCGPAVMRMLLSYVGIKTLQRKVVETTGVAARLKLHGMNVKQLAEACAKLAPTMQFWYKDYSNLKDVAKIVNEYEYPVAVEWQGVFWGGHTNDDEEEDEEEGVDDDPGHYSVVTGVDLYNNEVWLADPYHLYAGKDRKFTVMGFEERWWDDNEVIGGNGGRRYIEDYHMMFVVTPKFESFPLELNMNRGEEGWKW